MTRQSNEAELAKSEETGPQSSPQASAEGSLAPHALPSDGGLEPEDLAVLPGHGKSAGSRRIAPAAAVLALLLLGVYSFTRDGATAAPDESPSAAAAPGLAAAAPAPAAKPAPKPAEPEALVEEEPTRKGLPMMMAPPAADTETEAPDLGPNGPSVGRFPDLPPSVISYLKKVDQAAKSGPSAAPVAAEAEAAQAPAAP